MQLLGQQFAAFESSFETQSFREGHRNECLCYCTPGSLLFILFIYVLKGLVYLFIVQIYPETPEPMELDIKEETSSVKDTSMIPDYHACLECNYVASSSALLGRHEVYHQRRSVYQCPHCSFSVSTIRYLKKHLNENHYAEKKTIEQVLYFHLENVSFKDILFDNCYPLFRKMLFNPLMRLKQILKHHQKAAEKNRRSGIMTLNDQTPEEDILSVEIAAANTSIAPI